ncbi:GIY-YIG nuclease family protein [Photobacterium profundum]|uniref:GIY-YIG nuclease family protein n=1 Tax=Photobacterium profundum TaxID=74109 RepID=UPI0012F4BDA4|nr:GIY-YIG nuclease family protein [Photobacterium profundum]
MNKARTPKGGYNAAQLRVFGIDWNDAKNWRKNLLGKKVPLMKFIMFVEASKNRAYLTEIINMLPVMQPPLVDRAHYIEQLSGKLHQANLQMLNTGKKKKQVEAPECVSDVKPKKLEYVPMSEAKWESGDKSEHHPMFFGLGKKSKSSKKTRRICRAYVEYGLHEAARLLAHLRGGSYGITEEVLNVHERDVTKDKVLAINKSMKTYRKTIQRKGGVAVVVELEPIETKSERAARARAKKEALERKKKEVLRSIESKLDTGSARSLATKQRQLLYVIRVKGSNVLKIGISKNPKSRMADLQTSNASRLVLSDVYVTFNPAIKVEKALHKRFNSRRLQGEWFSGVSAEEIEEAIKDQAVKFNLPSNA